ncbi:MAG: RDD family protein [Planctomycetia bacterium]|nr:RDD family protein [Planctomycetia bacterium]
MTGNGEQLDTTIEVVTPENIAFRYRIAGPYRRLLAFLIDFAIRFAALMLLGPLVVSCLVMVGLPGFGSAVFKLLYFGMAWLYGGVLETYWNGQTVGKRAMGIRVLTTDGRPINGMQAMMRNIFREVDSMPIFTLMMPFVSAEYPIPLPTYVIGLSTMIVSRRFQRLGDMAADTIVVREERNWIAGLVKIEDPAVIRLAANLPAGIEFSRTMREALASYVERRRFFPPGRRADIARHVGRPFCQRYGMPQETSHDLLLCALYYRAFVTEVDFDAPPPSLGRPTNQTLWSDTANAPIVAELASAPRTLRIEPHGADVAGMRFGGSRSR